ncbi:hypothetical protein K504DRAFT_460319 [Pleomassaria siparia CBS 279.74]|uniref:Secreted protein n=1 Tax=Pleomassaria siparia CBS 279.74 TaxID=1314801 RepID=A0A6G1JYB9_9PLEO|nr:hypothetical protein K504DRAFT_460319 [Pleomassaria siparia CBS 279.74]
MLLLLPLSLSLYCVTPPSLSLSPYAPTLAQGGFGGRVGKSDVCLVLHNPIPCRVADGSPTGRQESLQGSMLVRWYAPRLEAQRHHECYPCSNVRTVRPSSTSLPYPPSKHIATP